MAQASQDQDTLIYSEPPSGPVPSVVQYNVGPEVPLGWRPAPEVSETVPSVPVRPLRPRTHVVADGETLSSIAKKFYGPEEGNKLAVVERIFKANRDKLDSVDDIVVGQKLLIPPMSESDRMINVLGGEFRKVENMGGKPVAVAPKKTVGQRIYTVKEDDSLWSVAEKELGNGKRYIEIAKLNAKALNNENNLTVGMRLKLPNR